MTPKLRRKPRITLTPTFPYPKITKRQPIAISGKERNNSVLFRCFRVTTNFEPGSGGRLIAIVAVPTELFRPNISRRIVNLISLNT
jgi:hypothetical protein